MGVTATSRIGGGLIAVVMLAAFSLLISGSSPASPPSAASVPSWEVTVTPSANTPTAEPTISQAGAAESPSRTDVALPPVVKAALPQHLAVSWPSGKQLLATDQPIGKIHVGITDGHWDPIDPQVWDQAVYWDSSALPGTDSTGTTSVYGHACKNHTCPFTALGLMSPVQLKQLLHGKIVVRTRNGTLTYTIDTIGALSKTGDRTLSTVNTANPGNRFRLVLCEYDGLESTNNYYVEGVLTSAEGSS